MSVWFCQKNQQNQILETAVYKVSCPLSRNVYSTEYTIQSTESK